MAEQARQEPCTAAIRRQTELDEGLAETGCLLCDHQVAGEHQIEGNAGDTFEAGRLGSYTVGEDGVVLLGPPFTFDTDNIDDFDF